MRGGGRIFYVTDTTNVSTTAWHLINHFTPPHLTNSGEDWKVLQPRFVVSHLLTWQASSLKIKGNVKTQRRKVWRWKKPGGGGGGGVGDVKRSKGHLRVLLPDEVLERGVFPSSHRCTQKNKQPSPAHIVCSITVSLSQIFDCKPSTLLFLGWRFCFACLLHAVAVRTF